MTENWHFPIIPSSIPTSTLAKADELVSKTAFLAGLVAPETAACLSELLRVTDANFSSVIDGNLSDSETLERTSILEHHQSTVSGIPEQRRRIVAVLCQHYHLIHERKHHDGSRPSVRALTIEHFAQLGLQPHLWSLSRGLGRRLNEYQSATSMNEPIGKDGIEAAQKRTDGEQLAFINLMLDVCHEEVDYMTTALSRHQLRESVTHAYRTNSRLKESGIRPETMPALLALLIQGALPRSEFVTFTGLPPEAASDQISKLISIGVVVSPPSNLYRLEIGLPVWFAEEIFPDL